MGYSNVSGLVGNCVVIKSDVGNVRIPSVVYSIQQNTVTEHTQMRSYSLNFIRPPGNLANRSGKNMNWLILFQEQLFIDLE